MTQQVAKTILAQLGGNKFLAMTGANSLASGENALSMRLPRNPKGINAIRIELNGRDLYDLRTFKMRGFKAPTENLAATDVCCENLRETFERATGLLTSL